MYQKFYTKNVYAFFIFCALGAYICSIGMIINVNELQHEEANL